MPEETIPPDLDGLLHDLQQEFGPQAEPQVVGPWLADLQLGEPAARLAAAEALGGLDRSNEEIVRALIAARVADPSPEVKAAAARALEMPAQRAILDQQPRLRWTTAVEAIEPDDRPIEPRRRLPRPKLQNMSFFARLDEMPQEPGKGQEVLAWILAAPLLAAIGLLILVRALLEIGVLWIVLSLLGSLAVIGILGSVKYETSKCPECGRPFGLKLVREETMGPGKRKKRLVTRYRYWTMGEVREFIVDEIYRCKYCGHRSRVTRQIKGST